MTGVETFNDVGAVAWSRDGGTLFAGGAYFQHRRSRVRLEPSRRGTATIARQDQDTVMNLIALPDGDLLVADAAGFPG